MVYNTTDVHEGQTLNGQYRESAAGSWVRGPSGWRLTRSSVHSREEKGDDGRWRRSDDYEPDVTAWTGGGEGQAPIAALKKVLAEMIRGYTNQDLIAATRPLSPFFYQVDVNGQPHTREQTVQALRLYFDSDTSLDYRANFVIDSWTKNSAKVRSSSLLGVLRSVHGHSTLESSRQSADTWWVRSQAGWQIDHIEVISTSYADGKGQWHTQQASGHSKL